jgi:hypothetical protein
MKRRYVHFKRKLLIEIHKLKVSILKLVNIKPKLGIYKENLKIKHKLLLKRCLKRSKKLKGIELNLKKDKKRFKRKRENIIQYKSSFN